MANVYEIIDEGCLVYLIGCLPYWLSILLVVYIIGCLHIGCLPYWLSTLLVVYLIGCLPYWLSTLLLLGSNYPNHQTMLADQMGLKTMRMVMIRKENTSWGETGV